MRQEESRLVRYRQEEAKQKVVLEGHKQRREQAQEQASLLHHTIEAADRGRQLA